MTSVLTSLNRILYDVNRPARYTGGEWNSVVKDWDKTAIHIALSYPDVYEIGMSNMAVPILYRMINGESDALAERVYAPWGDMAAKLRENRLPLYSLESRRELREFDIIGFSLGYELTYTNVLEMLDLAGIPVLASERGDTHPLVIAGGTTSLNPEPMSDFIDLFALGDGEELIPDLLNLFREWKQDKLSRKEVLKRAATIPGIYVPGLYEVAYGKDGGFCGVTPVSDEAKLVISRRIAMSLGPPVVSPVVPYIEIIHDRGALEIQRGCTRGCRFCQASSVYRPVRERSHEEVVQTVGNIIKNCGYNEISLVSLSSSDYPGIEELVRKLVSRYGRRHLSLQLPSLRIDNFSVELMESLTSGRKTGLTFAPEAGSERLRQVINKPITNDEIMSTADNAFMRGWTGLKLYFMMGLPTETMQDMAEIVKLLDELRLAGSGTSRRKPQLRVSLGTFIPKPHTPFQWAPQEKQETQHVKHEYLRGELSRRGIRLSWSDPKSSLLEAALSRGDRRLGRVIHRAWKSGATFDAWNEVFDFSLWKQAFESEGLDMTYFAERERELDEPLPWGHIDTGVSPEFLRREYALARVGKLTPDCRYNPCVRCGLEKRNLGCVERERES